MTCLPLISYFAFAETIFGGFLVIAIIIPIITATQIIHPTRQDIAHIRHLKRLGWTGIILFLAGLIITILCLSF